ncbi:unnamed protein product [Gordionus sp. m RMFG-2023]
MTLRKNAWPGIETMFNEGTRENNSKCKTRSDNLRSETRKNSSRRDNLRRETSKNKSRSEIRKNNSRSETSSDNSWDIKRKEEERGIGEMEVGRQRKKQKVTEAKTSESREVMKDKYERVLI